MERSSTKTFNAGGVHVLIDMKLSDKLDNCVFYESLTKAVEDARATPVEISEKAFDPEGYTMLILLEESHASVHYWPEEKYVAFDFFFCGEADHDAAISTILKEIDYENVNLKIIDRKIP